MIRQIIMRRLVQLVAVCWGVGTLTYLLVKALPGDMAYRIAASRYGADGVDATAAELVRQELDLDAGGFSAYVDWLLALVKGDFGNSLVSGLPVIDSLASMLGHSVLLAVVGLVVSAAIAFPVGLMCAAWGGLWDKCSLVISTLVRATPIFVLGVISLIIFALELPWFPVAGAESAQYLVLPALTLGVSLAAVSNRIVCSSARTVFASPYYQFARTKGLSAWRTFFRHGVRNLAVPVVAFMGIQLVTVVEGMVMIESLFSWPGIGHGLAHAVFARDIPIIQGAALLMGALFVVLNLVVDVLCYLLDPRGEVVA
ncbi:ABC transporter permease [Neptunomonas phycophila]|uniref:ABC transporter permease n=1 Tax=Neptunomonas TaxID=75687 RepID=UPI0025B07FE9|nr:MULTISPECIES: ABC transporter permease [Neptunomonas]MDN2659247.1 ABC transporter permease [Neptunomonas sp. CHC150]MDO6784843.1 ABC transporter permease [Neptunomonas phycophila]